MRYEFSSFCPTDEQLGAYIDRTLDSRDRERFALHLDKCHPIDRRPSCHDRFLVMLEARRDNTGPKQ